jgi:hypothetical protein
MFTIDHYLSQSIKIEIQSFIDTAYKKNKSPSILLPQISSSFPAIRSIIIDMQNPKFLNFSIQSYNPMFLLNDEHVICQYGKIFNKSIFSQNELAKLQNIDFKEAPHEKNIKLLIIFFKSLQNYIVQNFSIQWVDKHTILLHQKKDPYLYFLVGYDTTLTSNDIGKCQNLRGQISDTPCKDKRGKSCGHSKTWVCDLRFAEQIVLFSTNKGG